MTKINPFKYLIANRKLLGIYPLRDKSRRNLALINYRISLIPDSDPIKELRIEEYDNLMAYHHRGKWLGTRAMEGSKRCWKAAYKAFRVSIKGSIKLERLIVSASRKRLKVQILDIKKKHEIEFADGVPLVPSITPIVVLKGSPYEMGHQFASEIVAIFGPWILEVKKGVYKGGNAFEKWKESHRKYTPDIIEFAKGWADSAKDMKIPQSFEDVLTLWVGDKEPTKSYLNSKGGIAELPPIACSAIAAWGKATKDRTLIAGATADHDMSYQVTIAAYPDKGNPYIFTIFEATGSLPTVGPNWFFGHPGMNSKGLIYVHHGGGPKMIEPIESWGYGVRRGASVMHILKNKNSRTEALEQELSWPIGDVGYGDQATVGGFYADPYGAHIVESRKAPVIIRESGMLREKEFLFANNSVSHPDAIKAPWMSKNKDQWSWDTVGGWRPITPKGMKKDFKMLLDYATGKLDTDMIMSKGMLFAYWNSYNRNKFFNNFGSKYYGSIDEGSIMELYRTGGTMPEGDWSKAVREYKNSGSWGKISPAHSSNTLVVVMNTSKNLYSLCTGPAKRGLPPMSPDQAISVRGEKNQFWDLYLKESPEEMLEASKETTLSLLKKFEECEKDEIKRGFLTTSQRTKEDIAILMKSLTGNKSLKDINKNIRIYSRLHVLIRFYLSLIL